MAGDTAHSLRGLHVLAVQWFFTSDHVGVSRIIVTVPPVERRCYLCAESS